MKTVYIIGAQCTGKTTLVNALEKSYDADAGGSSHAEPSIIREVARTVLREKEYSREDIANSPVRAFELQKHILEAQHIAETIGGTSNPDSWCVCDRSGLDPIVYASLFVGPEAAAEMLASQLWKELKARMKDGIVILCEAGCHWLVDDGTRMMPNDGTQWTQIDDAFRNLLQSQGIGYSIVSKDLADLGERVAYARGRIDASQRATT
jgi:nicotinamide riboside kinase